MTAESDSLDSEPRHGLRGLIRDLCSFDRSVLAILVTVPLALAALEYYGMPWHYLRETRVRIPGSGGGHMPVFAEWLGSIRLPGPSQLAPYLWWGIAVMLLQIVVPLVAARFVGLGPRQLGLRVRGAGRDGRVYLVLYLLFLPVLFFVSRGAEFQATYPFYVPTTGPLGWDFVVFELVYCLQFLAVEFFFRGFIVLGLKPVMGRLSVLVMLAPYCMIHFYKPFPEAIGAVGAGFVLGTLAYRTETVLYGWFLHYGVALTMDLLALHHLGLL